MFAFKELNADPTKLKIDKEGERVTSLAVCRVTSRKKLIVMNVGYSYNKIVHVVSLGRSLFYIFLDFNNMWCRIYDRWNSLSIMLGNDINKYKITKI